MNRNRFAKTAISPLILRGFPFGNRQRSFFEQLPISSFKGVKNFFSNVNSSINFLNITKNDVLRTFSLNVFRCRLLSTLNYPEESKKILKMDRLKGNFSLFTSSASDQPPKSKGQQQEQQQRDEQKKANEDDKKQKNK